jgi:hypothetical protein
MALLRQCLQELRAKHPDWDVTATGWPQAKAAHVANRRAGMAAAPLRRTALDTQRPPTA